jgi:hypothetical protein
MDKPLTPSDAWLLLHYKVRGAPRAAGAGAGPAPP